ncbi:MAG: DUF58 domain-containing protein [Fulvivirga sp.]|uniref:DUF58 domain-containing protein n=1 Tax=Fulvivirga sp. TaxID=1931237 RepID=UPI0032EDAA51
MKTDYQSLLKPEILNSIKGLELIARVVVEGYFSGLNTSRRVGAGMEFSQYRSYEPGDDLRLLDWKMLARSSRYYIKQSEIDTNIAVKFIVDASNSMQHSDGELSKMDYARFLVATLGYLAKHQGDAIGLFGLNENQLYALHPKVQTQHLNRFLHQLLEIKSEGKWPSSRTSTDALHDFRHKELIVFVTDMYESDGELTSFVNRLKTKRNEVIVIHLITDNELLMNYKGAVTLEDLETHKRVKVDASAVRESYVAAMNEHLEKTKSDMLHNGIDYTMFNIKDNIGEVINLFLKQRLTLL